MKPLADLANLDVVIEDEDKALILLSSLPDEGYEIFVLTLINGRTPLSYSEVITALVNLELRRKDKECSTSETSAEVLTTKEVVQTKEEKTSRNPFGSPWLVITN